MISKITILLLAGVTFCILSNLLRKLIYLVVRILFFGLIFISNIAWPVEYQIPPPIIHLSFILWWFPQYLLIEIFYLLFVKQFNFKPITICVSHTILGIVFVLLLAFEFCVGLFNLKFSFLIFTSKMFKTAYDNQRLRNQQEMVLHLTQLLISLGATSWLLHLKIRPQELRVVQIAAVPNNTTPEVRKQPRLSFFTPIQIHHYLWIWVLGLLARSLLSISSLMFEWDSTIPSKYMFIPISALYLGTECIQILSCCRQKVVELLFPSLPEQQPLCGQTSHHSISSQIWECVVNEKQVLKVSSDTASSGDFLFTVDLNSKDADQVEGK